VELLLFHVLMWGQSQDTIGVVAETLRLVEGQELEEGAFVVLELHLQLDGVLSAISLQGLDASVVLPDETLKLSGTVGKLGGSLG